MKPERSPTAATQINKRCRVIAESNKYNISTSNNRRQSNNNGKMGKERVEMNDFVANYQIIKLHINQYNYKTRSEKWAILLFWGRIHDIEQT